MVGFEGLNPRIILPGTSDGGLRLGQGKVCPPARIVVWSGSRRGWTLRIKSALLYRTELGARKMPGLNLPGKLYHSRERTSALRMPERHLCNGF